MKKILLLLLLILPLFACSNTGVSDKTIVEDENIITQNPPQEEVTKPGDEAVTIVPDEKEYSIKDPLFEVKKLNNINEVTMDDFFNLGNRVDIKVEISDEELNKLQADYETHYKSEIYRLASKVYISLTNYNNTFRWEFENVGIRQKGNTSRVAIINGDGNLNLNHYKLSFDETFSDPEMYDSSFIAENFNLAYDTREFLGMSGLDFKWNKNFDHTHIREIYSNYLYRASGILVQHSGLSTFSIIEKDKNNKETSMGLCTVYEPATKSMIKRALKSSDEYVNMSDWDTEKSGTFGVEAANYGDLYKCIWGATLDNVNGNVGISNISGSYIPLYDRKTYKDVEYNDILLRNASNAIKSRSYDEISKYVDLEYLAICEAAGFFVGNPDAMRYNTNNYMVYLRRTDGKMIFIPIDSDRSFGIIKDWNPTGSAMMYLGMLDRKTVNNNDTLTLLLDTILATKDNEAKQLYIKYCNIIKESTWVSNDTFNKYFDLAKASYSEYYFSLTDESTNVTFSKYISNKVKQVISNENSSDNNDNNNQNLTEEEYDNIYLVSTINDWYSKDEKYKLKKITDNTYTVTVTITKVESDGDYFKFKFNNGDNYNIIDWTVSEDLKTLIKEKGRSVRCYGVAVGDSVTITINTKTNEVSVVIN